MSWTIWAVMAVAVDWAIRVTALILIPRDRRPSSAMAWLLAIFLIPFVGIFFFLLLGSPKLPRSRRDKQRRINAVIASGGTGLVPANLNSAPDWLEPVVRLNQALGAGPMAGGNSAALISDYQCSIDAMTLSIGEAKNYVHVEFYIIALDDTTRAFFDALEAAVARGVTVRLLLDHVASVRTATHRETFAELDRIGALWHFMLPVQPLKGKYQRPDLRNHRKLVVVDGAVGFIGSQNLISPDYNSAKNIKRGLTWRELVTRVTGPVVQAIDVVFLSDWFCETDEVLELEPGTRVASGSLDCQVIPSGPGFDGENNLRLFLALITSAREKVIITSPYFVPDESMMYAITSAAQRGLQVELFVSEIGDQGGVFHAQRSYYGELLQAGVAIWMYPAPFILHAKHLTIDETVAVIGSSNMDIRSFALDLEVSLLVHGGAFVREMRAVEAEYRRISTLLTLEAWEKEPLKSTFLDGLARLTSALQ